MLDLNDFGFGALTNSELVDTAASLWQVGDVSTLKMLAAWLGLAGEPELSAEAHALIGWLVVEG
jgi:hypothetical protein